MFFFFCSVFCTSHVAWLSHSMFDLIMLMFLLFHCILCVCVCVVQALDFLSVNADKTLRKCFLTQDDNLLPQQNSNEECVYYTPSVTLFNSIFMQ